MLGLTGLGWNTILFPKGPPKTGGSFFMAEITLQMADEFWHLDYFKQLNDRGKLAFTYSVWHVATDGQILLEDASIVTGIEITELDTWFKQFIRDGKLDGDKVKGLR